MIKSALYYSVFFGIGGAIILLLCVDLGQGTPACMKPRKLAAAGGSKVVKLTRNKAARKKQPTRQPKKAKVAKKVLEKDDTKHKRELEKSKIRIKRLEQRLARLTRESAKLMQAVGEKLASERAAREKAQKQSEQAQKAVKQINEKLARAERQRAEERKQQAAEHAAEQKKLLQRFEKQRTEDQQRLAARHAAAQQQLLQRFEKRRTEDQQRQQQEAIKQAQELARTRKRQEALEATLTRQASELAAQKKRTEQERKAARSAQRQLNTTLTAQAKRLESERKRRKLLEQQLADQARRSQLAREADRREMKRRMAEQARRQAAELAAARRRMSELARRPRARPARAVRRVSSWQQYLDFLAPVQSIRMDRDGAQLPVLDFNGEVFASNLSSIMRFYQMGFYGMLIYRERNEKDPNYLHIDLSRGTGSPRFIAKNDPREVDNLASIGLLWNSSAIGRRLMARIKAERPLRIPDGAFLALVNLFPRSTAQYFIWKRIEVCKRNGIDPAKVNRCLATFKQTSFGTWIVVIRRLEMKDGRIVQVTDFEEKRVSLRQG